MSADAVVFNFAGKHPALAEGFDALGVARIDDRWSPGDAELAGCRLAVVDVDAALKSMWRTRSLRRRLARRGVPLVIVDRDAPWHKGVRPWRIALFRAVAGADGYATHSLQGCESFPYPTLYFPNGVRLSRYHLHGASLDAMRDPEWYRWDVSFIGNLDGEGYPEHRLRAQRLEAIAQRLKSLGLRLRFASPESLAPDEDIEIIQHSRINLQLGSAADDGGSPSWGLPERCFGIPACGGFLLSDERLHAGDDFDSQTEWASFADDDEALVQIRRYLADLPAARRIADAAHRHAMASHTYRRRAARLIEFGEALRSRAQFVARDVR